METAAIGYRIVDFLKRNPPFNAMEEADLLALSANGRVRFFEKNDYILWQGEPHKLYVFVIQQGTVSLWDDAGAQPTLRDIRGTGDLLGVERFNGAPACLQTAKAESDVLIYAFQESDFDTLLWKYPNAREYVAAYSGVAVHRRDGQRGDPQQVFIQEVVRHRPFVSCQEGDRISDVARRLLETASQAVVVLDIARRALDVVTADRILGWVAQGGGDAQRTVADLLHWGRPLTLGTDASVADGVLAMAAANIDAVALTSDGSPAGQVHAVATSRDLAPVFGDQPAWILREIALASDSAQLRDLNRRARALVLRSLVEATSVDWLVRFTHLVDAAIVGRLIVFTATPNLDACWCFSDSAGRAESLTMLAPGVEVILRDDGDRQPAVSAYERVIDGLAECGYIARDSAFDRAFSVASLAEWQQRYRDWITDPVMTQMYRAVRLFDLRAIHGPRVLWEQVAAAVAGTADPAFLRVLANDCLASLPPLTFFQDAVVDESGEQSAIFRLEQSALRPLVDVGRVFGIAAGSALGRSTLERFAVARGFAPDHESIFREASDAFRTVLWQQGRVGISQESAGFELPPAALSRHDRHVLKSCFRSILELIEFTADFTWLERV